MLKVAIHAIRTESGADVFFRLLAEGLAKKEGMVCTLTFHHPLFRYVPRLLQAVPLAKTDVIISDVEYAAALRRGSAKLLSTAHQCVFDPQYSRSLSASKRLWHRFVIRPWTLRSLKESVVTTACSDSVRALLLNEFPEQKIVTVRNGIDTQAFSPDSSVPRSKEKKTVLFVGNFIKRKGVAVLPRIADILGEKYVIRCISGLRNAAPSRAMSTSANIIVIPSMPRDALVDEYRKADTVLIPSLHEGFGYIAAEAMACGAPCVCSGVNGLREIVTDDCGRTCPDHRAESYVQAIRAICEDEVLREKLSREGRKRVESHFTLEEQVRSFHAILCGF